MNTDPSARAQTADLGRAIRARLRRWADTPERRENALLALARLGGTPASELPQRLAQARSEGLLEEDRRCDPAYVKRGLEEALSIIDAAADDYHE